MARSSMPEPLTVRHCVRPGSRESSPEGVSNDNIEARLRRWAEARALPPLHVRKWLALDEPSKTRLLEIAETLKMRAGQCIAALGLLEEIATRENQSIAEILQRPGLRRIFNSAGSGPGRARAMLDELRALRYPRLKHAAQRLSAEINALKLPPTIHVFLPRDLASDEVRIQLVAHGTAEMQEALACLAAKSGALVRVAAMLSGADAALLETE